MFFPMLFCRFEQCTPYAELRGVQIVFLPAEDVRLYLFYGATNVLERAASPVDRNAVYIY